MKPFEKPRNPPLTSITPLDLPGCLFSSAAALADSTAREGLSANICRPNSACHHEITDTGPGRGRLQRGPREKITQGGAGEEKHLPDLSQKMFNGEWRKHCLPGLCVCVYAWMCVCVLSMHLTLRTTGGGPLWAHMAQGCGYVTATWGSATPDRNRTGNECTEGPHPHQHNMSPPDRTNYTACTPPTHHRLMWKTSSHYLSTRLQCLHLLSGQWSLCCKGCIRGEARAWLLIWSYLLSYATRTLSYSLGVHTLATSCSETLEQNHTNSYASYWWMDSRDILLLVFRRGNSYA